MSPPITVDGNNESTPSKATGVGGSGISTEFEPPLACVRRLLKSSLPTSTNVGKDASSAFARACGIFVIYLTACANDFARENKRQTITANDIMSSVSELDFEEFTPQLTAFLEQHRKEEKEKRERKKASFLRKSEGETAENQSDVDDLDDDQAQPDDNNSMSQPARKKMKTGSTKEDYQKSNKLINSSENNSHIDNDEQNDPDGTLTEEDGTHPVNTENSVESNED